ncbi:ribonuclease Z [Hyunsoonleella ulvae]|uniref:ribonuclease Z n=1 Tax=Hyunsoonleella ulvae TaxID=2799948 RepID=UPI001939A189|nr:ribonuclease Z [Hyunsoonleella ulvae]
MIIDRKGNIAIITQEKVTVVELVKKLEALYPKFKNDNIITVLTSLEHIDAAVIAEFLQISNIHRGEGHSFVIVSDKVNLDDISEELIVVPTQQEALDIIEMEEMERDLGF